MSVKIAYQQAVDLLEAAVEDRGVDYVYPKDKYEGQCIYFGDEGEPACIVGWVLDRLGITAQMAFDCGWNEDASVDNLANDATVIEIDEPTKVLLTQAQSLQDTGKTWGDAVKLAIEKVSAAGFDLTVPTPEPPVPCPEPTKEEVPV